MSDQHYLVAGDLLPELFWRMSPPTDLTNCTGVTFSMQLRGGAVVLDDVAAVIADGTYEIDGVDQTFTPADGVVIWAPVAGQTDVPGIYEARFRATFPGPKPMSSPNYSHIEIIISGDIA